MRLEILLGRFDQGADSLLGWHRCLMLDPAARLAAHLAMVERYQLLDKKHQQLGPRY